MAAPEARRLRGDVLLSWLDGSQNYVARQRMTAIKHSLRVLNTVRVIDNSGREHDRVYKVPSAAIFNTTRSVQIVLDSILQTADRQEVRANIGALNTVADATGCAETSAMQALPMRQMPRSRSQAQTRRTARQRSVNEQIENLNAVDAGRIQAEADQLTQREQRHVEALEERSALPLDQAVQLLRPKLDTHDHDLDQNTVYLTAL